MDNNAFEKFYKETVEVKMAATRQAMARVGPIVDEIVRKMHKLDERFPLNLERSPENDSYYQGLKAKKQDEFVFIIPIQGVYNRQMLNGRTVLKRYFRFDRPVDERFNELPEDVVVEKSDVALTRPDIGFMPVRDLRLAEEWNETDKEFRMNYDGYVIPYLVKLWFKRVLRKVVEEFPVTGKTNEHNEYLTVK